ncbi:MAG: LLM class flavin-dependent oxidoreductase [Candidatus Limnocylindrales bacterium]
MVDHLVDTDGPPEAGCLEGWTLLAAVAARTSRIRLGILVSSNTFRHPAVLLKEAVTVDHISGGRVILGIGTGWNEDEHRRYGVCGSRAPASSARVHRFLDRGPGTWADGHAAHDRDGDHPGHPRGAHRGLTFAKSPPTPLCHSDA